MMYNALRVSVLITPHTSCMLHIFVIISSIIKTRMTIVKKIGAETMVVAMMEARMMVVPLIAEMSPTLRSLILSLHHLQGTPLPPPAVPPIQVHVITVVAVGVNMSAFGKSCFICTHVIWSRFKCI